MREDLQPSGEPAPFCLTSRVLMALQAKVEGGHILLMCNWNTFPFPFRVSSKHLSVATNIIPFPKGLLSMSAALLVR